MAELLEMPETAELPFTNHVPEPPQTITKNNKKEQELKKGTLQTNEPRQETQQKSKIKKKKTAIEQLNEKSRRQ